MKSAIRGWLAAIAPSQIASRLHLEWSLLGVAAVALVFAFIAGQQSRVQLQVEAQSSVSGSLQVFHASNGEYSELRAHVWPLPRDTLEHVSITIPTEYARHLRLDPAPGMGDVRLCNMRLRLSNGQVMPISAPHIRGVNEVSVSTDDRCALLSASVSASDPQASVDLSSLVPEMERVDKIGKRSAAVWAMVALACFLAFCIRLVYARGAAKVEATLLRFENALPGVYFVAALVFGSILGVLTPPGAVPDEPAHITKVILVENGHWLGADGADTLDPTLNSVLGPFQDFLNPGRRFSASSVFTHAATPLDCRPSEASVLTSAANYSPILYMPASFVLNVACRTGATTGSFVYGGRLANLLVAVLLTFIGLRAAGTMRWPLFVIALFPMTIFEQVSMTADSLTLGMSFCLIGLQAGVATGNIKPGRAAEAGLLALGIGLALSKPGYAWLCVGFLFSYAAYKNAGRGFWSRVAALVVLPWLVHVVWIIATAQGAVPLPGVEPARNLAAIFSHPASVLGLLSRTFLGPGREFLWSSMVGQLGWMDVVLHPSSYVLAGLAVLTSLAMRSRIMALQSWTRPSALVLAAGAAMLPVIPMYLYWTPLNAILIEGLQGRYFIPAVAFLLVWVGFRGPLILRAISSAFIMAALLAVNIDAVYSLASRYYG